MGPRSCLSRRRAGGPGAGEGALAGREDNYVHMYVLDSRTVQPEGYPAATLLEEPSDTCDRPFSLDWVMVSLASLAARAGTTELHAKTLISIN